MVQFYPQFKFDTPIFLYSLLCIKTCKKKRNIKFKPRITVNYIIIHTGLKVFVSLINFVLSATNFHFIEIDLDQRSHMETGYFFNAI